MRKVWTWTLNMGGVLWWMHALSMVAYHKLALLPHAHAMHNAWISAIVGAVWMGCGWLVHKRHV